MTAILSRNRGAGSPDGAGGISKRRLGFVSHGKTCGVRCEWGAVGVNVIVCQLTQRRVKSMTALL